MKPYNEDSKKQLIALHEQIGLFTNIRSFPPEDRFYAAAQLNVAARRLSRIAKKSVGLIAYLYEDDRDLDWMEKLVNKADLPHFDD